MNPLSLAADRILRWRRRCSSYRACFFGETAEPTAAGDVVLKDLARFCHAYKSTAIAGPNGMDPIASAVAQGRREVWLRIQAQLRLPDEAVLKLMEQES